MRVLLAMALVLSAAARADVSAWTDATNDLKITHHVEEIADQLDEREALEFITRTGKPEEIVLIEQIINLGEKIWTIIEKNKPVVNVKYTYANALPKGIKSSAELEGFSGLQHRSYRMYGKNGFNMTVYDLTYTLVHRYGGTYQGKGRYLDTVAVVPHKLDVMWGYTVNFGVENISTVNVGNAKDPVASLLMELNFSVSTVIKSSQFHGVYEFRGDSAKVGTIHQ